MIRENLPTTMEKKLSQRFSAPVGARVDRLPKVISQHHLAFLRLCMAIIAQIRLRSAQTLYTASMSVLTWRSRDALPCGDQICERVSVRRRRSERLAKRCQLDKEVSDLQNSTCFEGWVLEIRVHAPHFGLCRSRYNSSALVGKKSRAEERIDVTITCNSIVPISHS